MAGHSHAANVAMRKGAQDKKRGKLFSKLAKEIIVSAKIGGGDTDSNPRLRLAIQKAKAQSMPKDTIKRALDRGLGNSEGLIYEELSMEGYGPAGVAVMAEVLTDNRNRAASEIRHAYTRGNGNLGAQGCVGYLFQKMGVVLLDSTDEDAIMNAAIEAGADDYSVEDDGTEVLCSPEAFEGVVKALEDAGFEIKEADVLRIPDTRVKVTGKDAKSVLRLLDLLDDCDDVQKVHHNAEFDEAELETL
jgi:YebC/PmpR family DNA-binding regulatory protein